MPRSGTSQVDRSAPNERQPSEEGRFGRRRRRASSSADAEVFVSGQAIDSGPRRSPRLGETAALGERPRAPFALSWSGGKDSALVLWTLRRRQLEPKALITTVTESYERVSMHGVRRELLARQAEALGVPLLEVVAFGDLFLEEVRAYREGRLAAAGKRGLFPLWGHDTADLAREFLDAGFEATLVCVDPRALDPAFCGRRYDERLLGDLPPGVDPCGENGEFHTFVSAGPIFGEPVACKRGEIVEREGFVFCDLTPA